MNTDRQQRGSFLPDFCSARTLFVIILLAELLAIVLSLSRPPYAESRLVDLGMNSLFIQWVSLSCTAVLCLFRKYLCSYNDHWVAAISYGITLAVTYLIAELAWQVLGRGPDGYIYLSYGRGDFFTRIMGIGAIAWALALRYFYVQYQWRRRIESESEARFQALQSRIKPHFLFNCMNTIAGLIRRQPAQAEEAVEDLADLFRASLQDTKSPCTLQDEIDLCRRYLRIEQHRLGGRLDIVWELGEMPLEIQLPVLSLQPLVENAVYHGIEPSPEGGRIWITGRTCKDKVIISIENPVQEARLNDRQRETNHLALENVGLRLASYFKKDNLLQVEQDARHYKITISIPLTA